MSCGCKVELLAYPLCTPQDSSNYNFYVFFLKICFETLHSPGTPMRTELSRCEKDLPVRLARRLSLPHSNISTSKGRDDQEMVFSLEIVIE